VNVQVREFLAMLCYLKWLTGVTMGREKEKKKLRNTRTGGGSYVAVTPWNNILNPVT
jgi:hypothetical protein